MNRHMITAQEVQDYLSKETWEQIAGSWGGGSSKTIEVNSVTRHYRVTDHGKVTFCGPDLDCAVKSYNAAA